MDAIPFLDSNYISFTLTKLTTHPRVYPSAETGLIYYCFIAFAIQLLLLFKASDY